MLQANLPHVASIDFVSACDLEREKADRNARRFGALKAYTDFREMIEAEHPDAVAVCGPPSMHHELGLACLDLGCHVFLEKPPALTAAQTKELVDGAQRAGKMGMVATHWRHAQAHRTARQLAEEEEFGPVLSFRCHYAAPGPKSGIWGAESAVHGYLLGQVIHPVDCMRFLVGQEVVEVYAAISERPDGTTSYAVTFRFDGGAVGNMTATRRSRLERQAAGGAQLLTQGPKGRYSGGIASACSSTGESNGLLSRRLQVRVLPGAPHFRAVPGIHCVHPRALTARGGGECDRDQKVAARKACGR